MAYIPNDSTDAMAWWGHLFQRRYKAILVQKEAHLLELSRYVVLNPVRANMVACPEDWWWGSYVAVMNAQAAPAWLLGQFGKQRNRARQAYRDLSWRAPVHQTPPALWLCKRALQIL